MKRFKDNQWNLPHFIFIGIIIGIWGVTVYLTRHYLHAHFPENIFEASSMCDSHSFFSCDAAAYDRFSNIWGVPLGFFGFFIGALFSVFLIVRNDSFERTLKFIALVNGIGCFLLMLYSVIIIHSLCPFCTMYYALSWSLLFMFYKYSDLPWMCDIRTCALIGVILISAALGMKAYVHQKEKRLEFISQEMGDAFAKLPEFGEPGIKGIPLTIQENRKIRLDIFSDFQCPFCKLFAEKMRPIIREYRNDVEIYYYYYPLDQECNRNITRPFHNVACRAAYLSYCAGDRFEEMHDYIYENQESLSVKWINEVAEKKGLLACMQEPKVQELVKQHILEGERLVVEGTPSFFLNGKKLSPGMTTMQIKALIESLLGK